MKALIRTGLCAALGLMPAWSLAQEVQWRSAAAVAPAATAPAIRLGRAVPLGAAGAVGNAGAAEEMRLVSLVRGQSGEEKPLPPGPSAVKPPVPRPTAPDLGSTPIIPMPDTGFTAPNPRPLAAKETGPTITTTPSTSSPTTVWGGVGPIVPGDLLGLGEACDSCGSGCGTGCGAGSGFFNGGSLFGGCCNDCPDRPRFWGSAEYLLWYIKAGAIPPLVTASPAGSTIRPVLGLPTTTVLYNNLGNQPISGGRFAGGMWFQSHCNLGIDGSYFFLGPRSHTFIAGGNGSTPIGRPILFTPGGEVVEAVAQPGEVNGTVTVRDSSQLWGGDANLRWRACCSCNGWLDVIAGYRYLSLREGITITENLQVLAVPGVRPAGTNNVFDDFQTRNTFNGGQLGLVGQRQFGGSRWFIGGSAKLAVGNMHQTVAINGAQTFSGFNLAAPVTVPGGILALNSNIGHYSVDRFAVIPDVGLKIGYNVTNNLSLFVGADFLYISSVVRPGDQIDRVVDPTRIPTLNPTGTAALIPASTGPSRPAVLFNPTDFWVSGVSFGLQYRY